MRWLLLVLVACADPLGPLELPPTTSVPPAWAAIGVPALDQVTWANERSITLAPDDAPTVAGQIAAGLKAAGWTRTSALVDPTGQTQELWYRDGKALALATIPLPQARVSLGYVAVPAGVGVEKP
jgi:hypothetical protein